MTSALRNWGSSEPTRHMHYRLLSLSAPGRTSDRQSAERPEDLALHLTSPPLQERFDNIHRHRGFGGAIDQRQFTCAADHGVAGAQFTDFTRA